MVADFLVDYEYLARCFDSADSRDSLRLLKVLCSSVDNGNARMIVDSQKTCLTPMRELARTVGGAVVTIEDRCKRRILEWFGNDGNSRHRFRPVENYGVNGFVDQIEPRPFAVITDDGCPGELWGSERSRFTLQKYFDDNDREKKRIRMGLKRSFGRYLEPLENLREAIVGFCGDEREFLVIDRYAIGLGEETKIPQCCRNIVRWIDMMSNRGKRSCEFEFQVNVRAGLEINGLHDILQGELTHAWQRLMEGLHTERQAVRFRCVTGDGASFQDARFHDRYICSPTRVLCIGKGLDVFDNAGTLSCVTLHYSGRRAGDVLIDQLCRTQAIQIDAIILAAT